VKNRIDTKTIVWGILSDRNWHSLSEMTKLTKSTKVATRISDLRKDGWEIRNRKTYLKNGVVKSEYKWF
jgi:biotin operon repressor